MSNIFQPIIKTKRYDIWNLRTLTLSKFQSKKFVFTIKTPDYNAKVFQVFFNQHDGSLNVNFPYVPESSGIASIGSMTLFLNKQDINLEDKGKITSKRVKYAHKPDGRVHFSQDAQIKTEIIKQSVPLMEQDGHLFTINVHGLSRFEQIQTEIENFTPSKNRTILEFDNLIPNHNAYKIVGMWHNVDRFFQRSTGSNIGPKVFCLNPQGERINGFLIGPLIGNPMVNHALLVTCQPSEELDKNLDFHFLFIGGFDDPHKAEDGINNSEFLVIQYPVSNHEKLIQLLGSIDLDIESRMCDE